MPYNWSQVSETAKHRATLAVVNNATLHTKHYYNIGRYETNASEENWVVRWYLWHSFRYRLVHILGTSVPLLSR